MHDCLCPATISSLPLLPFASVAVVLWAGLLVGQGLVSRDVVNNQDGITGCFFPAAIPDPVLKHACRGIALYPMCGDQANIPS